MVVSWGLTRKMVISMGFHHEQMVVEWDLCNKDGDFNGLFGYIMWLKQCHFYYP
jgi:hypothetical protein